jgi:hypothetical protein
VDIGDNPSISKVDKCVIHKSSINGAGMEDGEVGVFYARGVEVWMRKGVSMQSHAIDRFSLLVTSLDGHTVSDRDIANVPSYLSLSLLIAEKQLVVGRVGVVVEYPVIAGVVMVLFRLRTRIDDTELRGGTDKDHWSFVCRAFTIGVNEVDESGYPG